MYAIIRQGGKQYKVAEGDTITVDRIPGDVGAKVELGDVLMVRTNEKTLTGTEAAKAKVKATILDHFKGDKVLVFKYKPKKNYHRTHGHRQQLTKVRVDSISLPKQGGRKKAAEPEESAPKAATAEGS